MGSTYFNLSILQKVKNCFKRVSKIEVKNIVQTTNVTNIPQKMLKCIRFQQSNKGNDKKKESLGDEKESTLAPAHSPRVDKLKDKKSSEEETFSDKEEHKTNSAEAPVDDESNPQEFDEDKKR